MLVAASLALMATVALAQALEVIDLKYRTAQELIPVIEPLLARGGALSGQDYKLFVRTTGDNLVELRRVIAQLDRAPQQLLVSVRTGNRQQNDSKGVSASGTVGTAGVQARAGAHDVQTANDSSRIASVAVLEGNAALINTGASIPIVTAFAGGVGRRPWGAAQTEYRELTTGFVVTPRTSGDKVILEISQQAESLRGGTIEAQRLNTQISGSLGEWLQLTSVNESGSSQQRGIATRQYSTQGGEHSVWIKVERM
jgi:type II secretory pathway component GspD/PulD (secretin)